MKRLERLNSTGTKITLSDLCEHLDIQNLNEVFVDSDEDEINIEEKGSAL
ncbi:hypothetical protein [Flavobacterium antarcticum]|nr:hypothetical protein [Flavobacterium antarcticum]